MSWYKYLGIKLKNNKNEIKEIADWLSENYVFNYENLDINKKEKSFCLYGDEYESFYKKGTSAKEIPDVKDIYKDISIAFPHSEYSGHAKIEDEYSINDEYFIECENGVLKIECPLYASVYDFYEDDNYEDYEEFCDDFGLDISEEEFHKYKNEERLYVYEGKVYNEEEYYDTCSEYFCENISDLISASKEENIDTKNLLEKIEEDADYMEKVPENLKNNRKFVIDAVRKNGFAITHLNNNLALDREIALEAVKSDPYVVAFLMGDLREDEELIKISESIRKTFPEEDWE